MEKLRKDRARFEQEWAERIAEMYDIFPSTVISIKRGLVGKIYRNGVYITRKQRTEEFLKLYFEGVKEGN